MGRRDTATDQAPSPGAAVRTLAGRSPSPWYPVAAAPEALVVSGGWQIEGLPATVRRAGPQAAERTVEFFTAQIRNPHTRAAYAAAVTRFFTWCDARGLALAQISPIAVATYIDEFSGGSPRFQPLGETRHSSHARRPRCACTVASPSVRVRPVAPAPV